MELFDRVKIIAKHFSRTDSGLAMALGLKQQTFCGYLQKKRQHNLWPLLPKILELFPQVNRNWLYFGEGEMTGIADQSTDARKTIDELRQELAEERRLNRQLSTRLLIDGVGDKHGPENIGQVGEGAG